MSFNVWYNRKKATNAFLRLGSYDWVKGLLREAFNAGITYERALQKRRKVK